MKKFAFISTKWIKKYYNSILNKERNHKYFSDTVKIWLVCCMILLSWFFYLKYISLSSTEWYFLRKANSDLSSLNFEYEILKTELLDKTQQNRWNMYWSNKTKTIVEVRPELVQVPNNSELTYNK